MQKPILLIQFGLTLFFGFSIPELHSADVFSNEASFLGGAGSTVTNADYSLTSSWRQLTQTSFSSGGAYENASGFLAAFSDDSSGFRIISFGFFTNAFHLTTPTMPGHLYTIQFTDNTNGSLDWLAFANTNLGVGIWIETNMSPTSFTFTDSFAPATSGGPSLSNVRFYRIVESSPTPPQ